MPLLISSSKHLITQPFGLPKKKQKQKQKQQTSYVTEYYSATKKNELMPSAATWIDLD